jgi:hypothetical protein
MNPGTATVVFHDWIDGNYPQLLASVSHLKRTFDAIKGCPYLALWMPQMPANRRKARHKAKARIGPFSTGGVLDPATARNEPQRAANASFSAC